MTMIKQDMVVSVTVNAGTPAAKREPLGNVATYTPDLNEIAIAIAAASHAVDKDGKPVYEDGLPIYTTNEANWVQSAISNAVKMAARNKLEPQSLNCKDGLKIAETMAELCAESSGGGNGEGLAILREVKELFAKYVATLGKSVETSTLLISLFSNKVALGTQSAAVKDKMKSYVETFSVSLTEEQADRYTRPLEAVIKGCETADTLKAATDF